MRPRTVEDLSSRLERFYDAVPRADARVETVGAFTLFVPAVGSFPYYARPTLGAPRFVERDVQDVRERQRELGVPEAFEWQCDVTPTLAELLRGCGLHVHEHPLQVLDGSVRAPQTPRGTRVTEVTADSADDVVVEGLAVAAVAFANGGTATGDAGTEALGEARSGVGKGAVSRCRARLAAGRAAMVTARVDETTAAVASVQLDAGVAEVVGVGALPSFRRRGLGAVVTAAVVELAAAAGAHTVFLSAGDDDVARMYASLGFRQVGTAGIAEPH